MSRKLLKHWAIFSTQQNRIVASGLTKKEAVYKRIQFLGTAEFSTDDLKMILEQK